MLFHADQTHMHNVRTSFDFPLSPHFSPLCDNGSGVSEVCNVPYTHPYTAHFEQVAMGQQGAQRCVMLSLCYHCAANMHDCASMTAQDDGAGQRRLRLRTSLSAFARIACTGLHKAMVCCMYYVDAGTATGRAGRGAALSVCMGAYNERRGSRGST